MTKKEYENWFTEIKDIFPKYQDNKYIQKLFALYSVETAGKALLAHMEKSKWAPSYKEWTEALTKINAKSRIEIQDNLKDKFVNAFVEKAINAYVNKHNELPSRIGYEQALQAGNEAWKEKQNGIKS